VNVPDEIRNCVCFIHAFLKGELRPIGTAFFIGVPLNDPQTNWAPFVVTARHVLIAARTKGDDGLAYLRLNTTEGGFRFVKVEDAAWVEADQSNEFIDIAAFHWTLGREGFTFKFLSPDQCADQDFIDTESIGVGDEVFLSGLFVNHHGHKQNVPIVRVGNIASMPIEPVATKHGAMEAYLIEARSVGGLSGSPVFVSPGLLRMKGDLVTYRPVGSDAWRLLGVMHGHWRAEVEEVAVDDGLSTEYVNMGIAIVIPIGKVLELFAVDPFKETIATMKKNLAARGLPTEDSVDGTDEFGEFKSLTKKLLNVPKEELDKKLNEGQ
jgi:hypothetical protein